MGWVPMPFRLPVNRAIHYRYGSHDMAGRLIAQGQSCYVARDWLDGGKLAIADGPFRVARPEGKPDAFPGGPDAVSSR